MPARKADGADRACRCRTYIGLYAYFPSWQARVIDRNVNNLERGQHIHCGAVRAGAATTRTKFSRRLRHVAFKCWLSERKRLGSFEAICPVCGGSSYLEVYLTVGRCLL
jgi:hypothetical protein